MTDREMIERALESNGFTAERWDEEHENGLTAVVEGTFTVLEGDDDSGLYDEGKLDACVVGSEALRNRSVSFTFTPDGYDGGSDVRDLSVLEHS